MDFKLSAERLNRKKEFYSVCKELNAQKPASYVGVEDIYNDDDCWAFHKYCAKEFARWGWLSLGWPAVYGGTGDIMDKVIFTEAKGYYDLPGVDVFGVGMLAPTLFAAGNEEVKQRFLPGIANAEVFWCELWSEPNAGSDLASLSSTSIRKGDEFILNGQKTWNTGAHRADWAFGVYKSDPVGKKHHNLTFLLFDMKSQGVTVRPLQYMNGKHVYNEVYLDDVRVPAGNIVGLENGGWDVVNVLAGFERSNIELVMGLVKKIEELTGYCNKTRRNGKYLSQDPVIRHKMAGVACEIEAARMLAYRIADQQSRSEMGLMDAAAMKVFGSELAERVADVAMEVLGPYGQVKHSRFASMNGGWEYAYQANFLSVIALGTNEIQRNIIAWYGLGLPRMK
ncbi:MAG: acyl-CoA dehydrogenase family protein [Dehalococcoidia bacterium]|jgi:alkylation response protein AidB-like acyl-CoA dehydrogenase